MATIEDIQWTSNPYVMRSKDALTSEPLPQATAQSIVEVLREKGVRAALSSSHSEGQKVRIEIRDRVEEQGMFGPVAYTENIIRFILLVPDVRINGRPANEYFDKKHADYFRKREKENIDRHARSARDTQRDSDLEEFFKDYFGVEYTSEAGMSALLALMHTKEGEDRKDRKANRGIILSMSSTEVKNIMQQYLAELAKSQPDRQRRISKTMHKILSARYLQAKQYTKIENLDEYSPDYWTSERLGKKISGDFKNATAGDVEALIRDKFEQETGLPCTQKNIVAHLGGEGYDMPAKDVLKKNLGTSF